ncbi:PREDICTED: mediator of RNA polymerase II transcription subunit 19 [Rhagoletis zephyria]|uniref:mediator of RNA polymerase II transcription subunit 19 n=1 Tax=Rhagoletis zephyria TaxID=28612 RepID=UPI0008112BBF|nr:PREDICTED: mediator of RNA polymerase II transcription subunit 19 [Rhagoletis zephyria]XP_036326667.1 mediator of RNA polymerase II transcription subunit 19 [Rhagoletis pomonella]XP_036326668.1 mediator of RNA polymerase II transcription subunit 19 [Rhagoletis pomonella]
MMNNYTNMMIGDQFRKMESTTYSPKSSPHGGRSPVVSRQDSSGTLKTTISLGKTPTIIQTGPFYSMKEPPGKGELTGDKDLMTEYGLHHTLTKFKDKKVKESLASFLPNLPGIYDTTSNLENSTLRSVIEKPPIGGKELVPLTAVQLAGFRLHPGPLPEQYRALNTTPARKHKNKHKKHKHKDGAAPQETSLMDSSGLETYERKHKKQKRHEDDKERKKRKKEKKRKKKSHSPEPSAAGSVAGGNSGGIGTGGGVGGGSSGIVSLGVMPPMGGSSGSVGTLGGGVNVLPGAVAAMQQPPQQPQMAPAPMLSDMGTISQQLML